tara:strand:- start:107 stop:343 length:237 start_codon:yes stop_codon:yes gene_type:complete
VVKTPTEIIEKKAKAPNQMVLTNWFLAIKKLMNKVTKKNPVVYNVIDKEILKTYPIMMPMIRQNVNLIMVKLSSRINM